MTEVLDLDTVFDRDEVKLDGKTFQLRNQQEFSILEWHRIVRMDTDARKLQKTAAGVEKDAEKLAQLQRDLAAMLVVDLDIEVPDWACAAILRFWAERVTAADGASPPRRSRRRTTAASSRGSKRSTAATPKSGSTSRAGR